jgi:hypothetical protein
VLNEPEDLLGYEFELEIKLEELVKFSVDVRVLNKAPITLEALINFLIRLPISWNGMRKRAQNLNIKLVTQPIN